MQLQHDRMHICNHDFSKSIILKLITTPSWLVNHVKYQIYYFVHDFIYKFNNYDLRQPTLLFQSMKKS